MNLASRQQHRSLLEYFAHDHRRQRCKPSGASRSPIETLDLIGENSAGNIETFRDKNLKRVTFNLLRQRDEQREA